MNDVYIHVVTVTKQDGTELLFSNCFYTTEAEAKAVADSYNTQNDWAPVKYGIRTFKLFTYNKQCQLSLVE